MWWCDQSLVSAPFLWEKLSWSQLYKDSTRKIAFFEGWSWFKSNNLGLGLDTNLKFCTSVGKGLKLKVKKILGSNPTFVEVTGEKLVGGELFCPPSWIGLKFIAYCIKSWQPLQRYSSCLKFLSKKYQSWQISHSFDAFRISINSFQNINPIKFYHLYFIQTFI